MTQTVKYIGLLALGLVVFSVFGFYTLAKANPSFFVRQNNGVGTTASTSVAYMTTGTATTTKYLDTGAAGAQGADTAVFTEQLVGSSTATTLNTTFEYAVGNGTDCIATPSSCDWYGNNQGDQATTTPSQSITTTQSSTLNFASTTQGGAPGNGDGRVLKVIVVRVPTRYVRAVLTLPVGSFNGAVWGEFVAKRQAN